MESDIEFRRFGGNLLVEPEKICNKQGGSFQVFTPFFKTLQQSDLIRKPIPAPSNMIPYDGTIKSDKIDDWELLPTKPNWAKGFEFWEIGETAARKKLDSFISTKIAQYADGRDFPAVNTTSLLSPHLRFGEISPAQIWEKVNFEFKNVPNDNYQKFLSELGWREFSYHLLTTYPDMANSPIKAQFAAIEWDNNQSLLEAWQSGKTGFPIVDAGMRELWRTGYMHNRVRMIVASFLIKDLLIDWRHGEKWFWDCLLDADFANNPASWQWVAGCGMDAAPYFRIFNPTTQSQKFDANGEYIKRWLPELRKLSAKYIHDPATAPKEILNNAGIVLGKTYPLPIVSHKSARERTLCAYGIIKGAE
jgi:deoxyribodipyrimidine photo-lyase